MQRPLKEEVRYLEGKLSENVDSILFARLADVYLQMDRIDDAIELCEKNIKKHPYYVTGHYVLGKCYLRKKLFDQAEKELKRVLLFDPKYIAAHRDYGELMAQIGWHNTCETSYEEIIRVDPFNEQAKRRLEELKSQAVVSQEDRYHEQSEDDLREVEEDILTEVTTVSEQDAEQFFEQDGQEKSFEQLHKEVLGEELAESPLEALMPGEDFERVEHDTVSAEAEAPPVVKEMFKETEDVFEEDKENLDMLEDIFRDDELPDLSIGEQAEDQAEQGYDQDFDYEDPDVDQKHLVGEEFKDEKDENEDFEGLEDDEIFALMSGDEDYNKPNMKSPLDIPEPPRIREPGAKKSHREQEIHKELEKEIEPQFGPSTEQTLDQLRKETKPQFEPPLDDDFPRTMAGEDEPAQTSPKPGMPDFNSYPGKKEKIVTPTLGEIYAAQHQYAKAIGVYEILRRKEPNNELYKQKIEYLQKKLEESQEG